MQERVVSEMLIMVISQICVQMGVFLLRYIFVNDSNDFTVNMHELKNWKRRNAILIANLLKRGNIYCLGNRKIFLLLHLFCAFSPKKLVQNASVSNSGNRISTYYFLSSLLSFHCRKQYISVVQKIHLGKRLEYESPLIWLITLNKLLTFF